MSVSSSVPAPPASFAQKITEKLSKSNYALWRVQVLPAMRGAQLEGFLDGTEVAPPKMITEKGADGKNVTMPNPEYARWLELDQQVLSYLLSSLSRDALSQVALLKTASEVWRALEKVHSSQSRARAVNTRIALATTQKGNMSITEYVGKMKSLADDLACTGKPIDSEELVRYILTGLDMEYNPIVTAILARTEETPFEDLLSQLLSFEQWLDMFQGGSS